MLSRTAEHALRAAILLARHYGDRLMSADEIAAVIGAPRNYLSKTLNTLTRRGILTAARGPGGGYALAMSPSELSIADITDVFEEARPDGPRCLIADRPCDRLHPCDAHQRWTQITLAARESLANTALSSLTGTLP